MAGFLAGAIFTVGVFFAWAASAATFSRSRRGLGARPPIAPRRRRPPTPAPSPEAARAVAVAPRPSAQALEDAATALERAGAPAVEAEEVRDRAAAAAAAERLVARARRQPAPPPVRRAPTAAATTPPAIQASAEEIASARARFPNASSLEEALRLLREERARAARVEPAPVAPPAPTPAPLPALPPPPPATAPSVGPVGYDPARARELAQVLNRALARLGTGDRNTRARRQTRATIDAIRAFQIAAGLDADPPTYGGETRGALIFYGIARPPATLVRPLETVAYVPPS